MALSISARPSAIIVRFQRLRSWSSSSTMAPLGIEPGRRARVLEQKQRREAHDLGLGREQPQQQPRQPDGLLAQRRAHVGSPPVAA